MRFDSKSDCWNQSDCCFFVVVVVVSVFHHNSEHKMMWFSNKLQFQEPIRTQGPSVINTATKVSNTFLVGKHRKTSVFKVFMPDLVSLRIWSSESDRSKTSQETLMFCRITNSKIKGLITKLLFSISWLGRTWKRRTYYGATCPLPESKKQIQISWLS